MLYGALNKYLIADNILPFDCAVRRTEDNTSKCTENSIIIETNINFTWILWDSLSHPDYITAIIGKMFTVHSKMTFCLRHLYCMTVTKCTKKRSIKKVTDHQTSIHVLLPLNRVQHHNLIA